MGSTIKGENLLPGELEFALWRANSLHLRVKSHLDGMQKINLISSLTVDCYVCHAVFAFKKNKSV